MARCPVCSCGRLRYLGPLARWPWACDVCAAVVDSIGRDLPEVIAHHERAADEQHGDRERAVCATCGWRGPWRKRAGGWAYRDFWWHKDKAGTDALNAVADGRARYAR